MKKIYAKILIFLYCMLLFGSASGAESGYAELKRNPFEKPKNIQLQSIQKDTKSIVKESPSELVLKGTLTAGDHSIANVNGNLLAVGEAIEGYTLVEVSVGSAVLLRDNEKLLLEVNENYKEQK